MRLGTLSAMASLTSLGGRLLRAVDRAAGTQFHTSLRAARDVGRVLAPDFRARAQLTLAALALGSKRLERPVRIRVKGPDGPRPFLLSDQATLLVLEEMFSAEEYAVSLRRPPGRILDLGSNVGASVLYFALRYPEAEIVAVEASPALFRLLKANVGDLPNVRVRHAAVSATSEPMVFYEGRSSWAGSTHASDWVHAEHATEVEGVPLDELLDGGVDLMKIDIEGGEFDVLPASRRLASVGAVIGELHAPPGTEPAERLLGLFRGWHVDSTAPNPAVPQYSTVFTALRGAA